MKRMPKAEQKKLCDAVDTVLAALDNPVFRSKLDETQRVMLYHMVFFLSHLRESMSQSKKIRRKRP
jgi:hypothetical protein